MKTRRTISEFTQLAADHFRRSAASEQEQRAALCQYFRRGAAADLSHPELIAFLGISTPSVLDMAGYSLPAASCVMEILRDMKDDELYGVSEENILREAKKREDLLRGAMRPRR